MKQNDTQAMSSRRVDKKKGVGWDLWWWEAAAACGAGQGMAGLEDVLPLRARGTAVRFWLSAAKKWGKRERKDDQWG